MRDAAKRWNHSTHYHHVVLNAIPPATRRALDVGCGEGTLTRDLRRLIPEVIGIDTDHASITAARAHPDAGNISYLEGDALAFGFASESFDLISAVASLHHMDAQAALERLVTLLRPGGVLAVVGLARSSRLQWPLELAAIIAHHVRRLRHGYWQPQSPIVSPPPESYASMRRLATRALPGARLKRRLYWRYTLIWLKPQRTG
jgi:SAM-dependent methyltransferase